MGCNGIQLIMIVDAFIFKDIEQVFISFSSLVFVNYQVAICSSKCMV